jgi:hypothetical protein
MGNTYTFETFKPIYLRQSNNHISNITHYIKSSDAISLISDDTINHNIKQNVLIPHISSNKSYQLIIFVIPTLDNISDYSDLCSALSLHNYIVTCVKILINNNDYNYDIQIKRIISDIIKNVKKNLFITSCINLDITNIFVIGCGDSCLNVKNMTKILDHLSKPCVIYINPNEDIKHMSDNIQMSNNIIYITAMSQMLKIQPATVIGDVDKKNMVIESIVSSILKKIT